MPFETRIQELSRELENCHDDTRTVEILTELQKVIHEQIEQIRGKANSLGLIHPTEREVSEFLRRVSEHCEGQLH